MQNHLFLYLLCASVWGSTWFAIKFQIDVASPTLGVFYRFLLSAATLLIFCWLFKRPLKFSRKTHFFFMGQGAFMFCLNYILTYFAETMANSGLIALTFTGMIYFNMIGMRFLFKQKIKPQVILGSLLGLAGISFIFYNDLFGLNKDTQAVIGIVIGLVGALSASIGNMFALRIQKMHVPILSGNAFGMAYGCLFTFLILILRGETLSVSAASWEFWAALGYLSILGTVIAFAAYIKLVKDIGAEKAAYTSILSTIIALGISSIYEGLEWTPLMALGVGLCLYGNVLVLRKAKN
ncbi:MAG: DMT family transporter [Bdellovibrionia bacterium]